MSSIMSSFTLSPSSAMASRNTRGSSSGSSSSSNNNGHWANCIIFFVATALFSLVLALSNQQGEPNNNNNNNFNNNNNTPSLFLGTSYYVSTVAAATAVATTVASTRTTSARTMKRMATTMTINAGNSRTRTLIELGSDVDDVGDLYDREDRYQIDTSIITYLDDEDYEQQHGLLTILRRASNIADTSIIYVNSNSNSDSNSNNNGNININSSKKSSSSSTRRMMGGIGIRIRSRVVSCFHKAIKAVKNPNPIGTMVLAGNIASMMVGVLQLLLPIMGMGLAGFLPAMCVTGTGTVTVTTALKAMKLKTNWTAITFLRRFLLSFHKGVTVTTTMITMITRPASLLFSKLKFMFKQFKFSKFVSKLYKNRSKYSLLSDYSWYVHGEEDKEVGGQR